MREKMFFDNLSFTFLNFVLDKKDFRFQLVGYCFEEEAFFAEQRPRSMVSVGGWVPQLFVSVQLDLVYICLRNKNCLTSKAYLTAVSIS